MSTSLAELARMSEEIAKEVFPDLSANTSFVWGWTSPEDFVKDMRSYKILSKDHVTDLSGAKIRWKVLEKQLETEKSKIYEQSSKPVGSNANWGRITQLNEMTGVTLEEVGLQGIKTPSRCAEFYQDIGEYLFRQQNKHFVFNNHLRLVEEGELSAPIVKAIEEEEDADTTTATSHFCKGCSKFFATKASLKRHHDRKKSCKDICEAPVLEAATAVPEKPYIVEWVDQLLAHAISGESDKPYCKHCDVEFANKSNLNKHLSKSVACDKLAKQEFLKKSKEIS